jgi:hypothetical protein
MQSQKDCTAVRPLEMDDEDSVVAGAGSASRTSSSFTRVLFFCQHFALVILACVCGVLFIDIQFLRKEVHQNEQVMADLKEMVQNQQQTQQDLTAAVDQEHSLTLYQVAGTFTLLACLLTMFHMTQHLASYHEPVVQRKIITILWMSPIYGVTSFLSLVFPSADGYLAVIKDFYESYVIYTFLSFLIAVLGRGDRQQAVNVLARHADHLDRPTKCLRSFYHPPPETSDQAMASAVLLECQILAMQFVFVRPLTSILRFIAETLASEPDEDDDWSYFKSPNFYIAMVTNFSVFLAFTGLLKFYHAVRDDLRWCKPFAKFMTIKGIVFLTFWQGLLITIIVNLSYDRERNESLPLAGKNQTSAQVPVNGTRTLSEEYVEEADNDHSAQEQAAQIQNFLICLEMLFFAIAHWCVFPAEEWAPDYRPQRYAKPGIGLKDFASDISYMVSSTRAARKAYHDARSSSVLSSEIDDANGIDADSGVVIESRIQSEEERREEDEII